MKKLPLIPTLTLVTCIPLAAVVWVVATNTDLRDPDLRAPEHYQAELSSHLNSYWSEVGLGDPEGEPFCQLLTELHEQLIAVNERVQTEAQAFYKSDSDPKNDEDWTLFEWDYAYAIESPSYWEKQVRRGYIPKAVARELADLAIAEAETRGLFTFHTRLNRSQLDWCELQQPETPDEYWQMLGRAIALDWLSTVTQAAIEQAIHRHDWPRALTLANAIAEQSTIHSLTHNDHFAGTTRKVALEALESLALAPELPPQHLYTLANIATRIEPMPTATRIETYRLLNLYNYSQFRLELQLDSPSQPGDAVNVNSVAARAKEQRAAVNELNATQTYTGREEEDYEEFRNSRLPGGHRYEAVLLARFITWRNQDPPQSVATINERHADARQRAGVDPGNKATGHTPDANWILEFGNHRLQGLLEDSLEAELLHEGITALIALERYRRDNNAIPTTLEDLIPNYLTRLPIDTLYSDRLMYISDAEPTRYIPLPYRLYSLGPDKDDDRALPIDSRWRGSSWGKSEGEDDWTEHIPRGDIIFGQTRRPNLFVD